MELQGSNIFLGPNRDKFPPALDHIQGPSSHQQQQISGNLAMEPEYGNLSLGQGNIYNPSANNYQTEDIFAATTNPFIETLRSLALNPSQINTLLSSLPGSNVPNLQVPQR